MSFENRSGQHAASSASEEHLAYLYGPNWGSVVGFIDNIRNLTADERDSLAKVAKEYQGQNPIANALGGGQAGGLNAVISNLLSSLQGGAQNTQQPAGAASATAGSTSATDDSKLAALVSAENNVKNVAKENGRLLNVSFSGSAAMNAYTGEPDEGLQAMMKSLENAPVLRILADAASALSLADLVNDEKISKADQDALLEPVTRALGSEAAK